MIREKGEKCLAWLLHLQAVVSEKPEIALGEAAQETMRTFIAGNSEVP
jgi:hypothetical protein